MQHFPHLIAAFVLLLIAFAKLYANDLTPVFTQWYQKPSVDFSFEEKSALREYQILLIPGYLSDFTIRYTPVGYFAAAQRYLSKQLGSQAQQEVRLVAINSQDPSSANVSAIAEAIAAASKQVILIGHSKGAWDSFVALEHHRELWPKVAGVITIQAPFFGTPLVDYITKSRFLRWSFLAMLKLVGGDWRGFEEFAPPATPEANSWIATLVRELSCKLLTFSSYLEPQQTMTIPLLRPFHTRLAEVEPMNDGLVPTMSGMIPGVSHIVFPGLDHTDPVVSWGERGRQEQFMGALLKVFLQDGGDRSVGRQKKQSVAAVTALTR